MAALACSAQESQPSAEHTAANPDIIKATLVTSKGDIHLLLNAKEAPITVANFVNLAQRGFYNNLNFHRVISDFMIQGGCPEGTGSGGPGYKFNQEISPKLRHDGAGVLAMANAGPNTNGSQFYITHKATDWLDGGYNIFGRVQGPKDQQVVNSIVVGDKITTIKIEDDATALKAAHAEQLEKWNAALDRKYPGKFK